MAKPNWDYTEVTHLSIAKDLAFWWAGIGVCGKALPGLNEYTTDKSKVTCPLCRAVIAKSKAQ